ncbi:hypothetical protein WICPIJ_007716 [Wickerhamomyces pijperi]|uniref:Uncharacterized protein n=1 Tax=Wickerhamomyces pijperi TaxID=599730 RepID=A0A9P8Q1Z8_WICPI|nr:hypothetical protein WICPIJ_007716 [Wickerhamomyces pijperi]
MISSFFEDAKDPNKKGHLQEHLFLIKHSEVPIGSHMNRPYNDKRRKKEEAEDTLKKWLSGFPFELKTVVLDQSHTLPEDHVIHDENVYIIPLSDYSLKDLTTHESLLNKLSQSTSLFVLQSDNTFRIDSMLEIFKRSRQLEKKNWKLGVLPEKGTRTFNISHDSQLAMFLETHPQIEFEMLDDVLELVLERMTVSGDKVIIHQMSATKLSLLNCHDSFIKGFQYGESEELKISIRAQKEPQPKFYPFSIVHLTIIQPTTVRLHEITKLEKVTFSRCKKLSVFFKLQSISDSDSEMGSVVYMNQVSLPSAIQLDIKLEESVKLLKIDSLKAEQLKHIWINSCAAEQTIHATDTDLPNLSLIKTNSFKCMIGLLSTIPTSSLTSLIVEHDTASSHDIAIAETLQFPKLVNLILARADRVPQLVNAPELKLLQVDHVIDESDLNLSKLNERSPSLEFLRLKGQINVTDFPEQFALLQIMIIDITRVQGSTESGLLNGMISKMRVPKLQVLDWRLDWRVKKCVLNLNFAQATLLRSVVLNITSDEPVAEEEDSLDSLIREDADQFEKVYKLGDLPNLQLLTITSEFNMIELSNSDNLEYFQAIQPMFNSRIRGTIADLKLLNLSPLTDTQYDIITRSIEFHSFSALRYTDTVASESPCVATKDYVSQTHRASSHKLFLANEVHSRTLSFEQWPNFNRIVLQNLKFDELD